MNKSDPHGKDMTENLPYQINFTANFNKAFARQMHKTFMDEYTTADEFAILGFLHYAPDISQIKIGKLLFRGKAHVGKILSDMEEKGLIERQTKEDNASFINCVTPKGLKIFQDGKKLLDDKIASKMEAEFSEAEIDRFISYLKRYRKVLGSIVDVNLK